MSEGKSVNKHHPDFSEYVEKCCALRDHYYSLIDAEEQRLKQARPNWMHCKDGLESREKRQLYRQMHAGLKALQKEYDYLFTEDTLQ